MATAASVSGTLNRRSESARRYRTQRQNDGCRLPNLSEERHVGRARVLQACSALGGLGHAANRHQSARPRVDPHQINVTSRWAGSPDLLLAKRFDNLHLVYKYD